jgi:hypothetical protein
LVAFVDVVFLNDAFFRIWDFGPLIQGTCALIQGIFVLIQGTFALIQGTFALIQGTFALIQGTRGSQVSVSGLGFVSLPAADDRAT